MNIYHRVCRSEHGKRNPSGSITGKMKSLLLLWLVLLVAPHTEAGQGVVKPSHIGAHQARGWALLVGIRDEKGCRGCESDVDTMKEIISGAGAYTIDTLKTEQATADAILDRIELAARTLESGDTFIFYFSGHGGQKKGFRDELRGYMLFAYGSNITDDDLARRLAEFAPGVRIVMMTDSCSSGAYCRAIQKAGSANFCEKPLGMNAQMIHFSASRSDEASAGYPRGGAFTLALYETWGSGGFSGTYREFYEAIRNRLKMREQPQEPQLNLVGEVGEDFLDSRPFSLDGKLR